MADSIGRTIFGTSLFAATFSAVDALAKRLLITSVMIKDDGFENGADYAPQHHRFGT